MLKKNTLVIILIFSIIRIGFSQTNDKVLLAQQHFTKGEYDKAKVIYEKLYQSNSYKNVVYDNYIATLIKLKEFDNAEKIIRKRLKEDNANATSLNTSLISLLKQKGDSIGVEKVYADMLKNMPADAFQIRQYANNFYQKTEYNLALKTFLNGRKILANETEFSYELINLYQILKLKEALATEVINILDYNPEFLPVAKSNIARSFETAEDYKLLKSLIIKKIQKTPQNTQLAELLSWTHIELKEYNMALIQTIALDKRTNDNGSRVFALANILTANKALDEATRAYNYLIEKGSSQPYYISAKVALLKIKQMQLSANTLSLADIVLLESNYEDLLKELGKNRKTLFAIRELANLKITPLNKPNEAELLLEEALKLPGLTAEEIAFIKLDLADVYTLNNDPWEASLLLSQVEKSLANHPLGQEAKFKNAKLSFYKGDFKWAKAQLDVLKASTSQLIANDALDLSLLIQDNTQQDTLGEALKVYARAEFLRTKNQFQKAIITLDSINIVFPNNELADDILLSKAKIYTSLNEPQKAINSYTEITTAFTNSIWTDDALYSLGILYEDQLKDKEKAISFYQKLIEDFPGSLFVIDARKRFRFLRGDSL